MNKKAHPKQLLNIAFVLVLALLTFFLLRSSYKELNVETLSDFFEQARPIYLVYALLCMLAFLLFEALSIHLILRRSGYRPKWYSSLAYSTSDIYYSALTPSATGGQPASAFYMIRDGIPGGAACFTLVFNLIAYTSALLIIGIVVLPFHASLFWAFPLGVKLLFLLGLALQVALLFFIVASIRRHDTVLRIAYFFISLLHRIHILKNEAKWRTKAANTVDSYRDCFQAFRHQNSLFVASLLCNLLQRTALIAVSAFVCLSISPESSFWLLFALQTFVMLGYNSFPLPGGTFAFEYLYLQIYALSFSDSITLMIMMVTRVISYYFSMILSGTYTALYHVFAKLPEESHVPTHPED